MSKKEYELAPQAFANLINDLKYKKILDKFDWENWRESLEWRVFVTGHNYGIEKSVAKIETLKNMEEPMWKLFGKTE
jgi:hypothetical protein